MSSSFKTPSSPFRLFRRWFVQVCRDPHQKLPEAMCLSTANARGAPSARMVLLKDYDQRGFNFFTNVHSPKARDLAARPQAALTFYWGSQHRQVRIEGKVTRLPRHDAEVYFATRPRASQIGSWASRQSQSLQNRSVLLKEYERLAVFYRGKKVPMPSHWQGYRVTPSRIEFWQERLHRLHDRWLYVRGRNGRWGVSLMYP